MEMMSENNMVNFQPESVATFTGIYNLSRLELYVTIFKFSTKCYYWWECDNW